MQGCDIKGVPCRLQNVLLVAGSESMGALLAHLREWGRVRACLSFADAIV